MKASSMVAAMALKYFDIAGRAEPIRILFHIAGVQYDDVRIPFKEWPAVKETTPLGFVPVLTIDGQEFCQSISLTRYAAKLAGWYPESEVEALKADMIAETVNEISSQAPRSKDEEEYKLLRKEFQSGAMKKYWTWIEGIIQENGGCFISGDTPTYADLIVAQAVPAIQSGMWDHIDKDFFDDYPGVLATMKGIKDNEQVKAYYDSKKEAATEREL
ncbi:unnamed protein product [Cylindrotheca closterium]|uniref:glutathione transferase n=1 Tax=Cylindrotheca closterium TaxID=2856 RepID=A0AAD2JI07_9STRA|nr:unnamed protein product [Cylindrotheca closterium]